MQLSLHEYQEVTKDFIIDHPNAAVILDMGMGKTATTLSAIDELIYDRFEVTKVLVIAPLRVASTVWSDEIEQWAELKHLRYSKIIGTPKQRLEALQTDADIYIVNRENLPWLVGQCHPYFKWDMVVIDELSSFKSWKSKRFKAFMTMRPFMKRVVGLTGTPSSNGLMDLFAEFMVESVWAFSLQSTAIATSVRDMVKVMWSMSISLWILRKHKSMTKSLTSPFP